MKKINIILLTILYLSLIINSNAGFWDEHARGWHWYEDIFSEEKKNKKLPGKATLKFKSATEELEYYKKQLQESLSSALLNPTSQKVSEYQKLQNYWLNQSQKFGKSWSISLLQNPGLDSTNFSPMSYYGKKIHRQILSENREEYIKKLAPGRGILVFFNGNCPYCKRFASVVAKFQAKYPNWALLGVSMDGVKLDEIENYIINNGVANKCNITRLPSIVVVKPSTEKVTPIGHSLLTLEQIEENIVKQFEGKEGRDE